MIITGKCYRQHVEMSTVKRVLFKIEYKKYDIIFYIQNVINWDYAF